MVIRMHVSSFLKDGVILETEKMAESYRAHFVATLDAKWTIFRPKRDPLRPKFQEE